MNFDDIKDIFEPFDKLVKIKILGETAEVPENNSLLRCFQYLSIEKISYADLCWNGDCLNCQVWVKNGDREKGVISCRTKVAEGMEIVRMSEEVKIMDNGQLTIDNEKNGQLTTDNEKSG